MKIEIVVVNDVKTYHLTVDVDGGEQTIICNATQLLHQGHFARKYLNSKERMWKPIEDWRGVVGEALKERQLRNES